jgi:hypothetical protein
MKKWTILSAIAAAALAVTFSANAQTTVTELLFNADGSISDQYPTTSTAIGAPVTVTSGFGTPTPAAANYLSGLGTLQYTVTGAGSHYFDAMIDDEADYVNGVFHDSASVQNAGSAPNYLSWEVGNPNADVSGDIKYNTKANTLDNANDVPSGNTDIAVALGFNFSLLAGQTATIDFSVGNTAPASGFYIEQYNNLDLDPYITGTLVISSSSGGGGVPDKGATWFSLLMGLAGLGLVKKIEGKFFPGRA